MKKAIILLVALIIGGFVTYNHFYNGFSNIDQITIKNTKEENEKPIIISDKGEIKKITRILNRAESSNERYKFVNKEDFELTILYRNNREETFFVHAYFRGDKTLLYGEHSYFIRQTYNKMLRIE
ncbi:hypothetical protein [Bacillus sp. 1P06AnD]|uniref:hypothetical protein n=1 Tax=Bacillus sp. 1P06AnD TaxID=3132208 RepID=UPI0039A3B912